MPWAFRVLEPRPSPSGGLLAMMTNSLMPFAFDRGGALAGIMTVVGFAVSVASAA